jgi:hypothetical protein
MGRSAVYGVDGVFGRKKLGDERRLRLEKGLAAEGCSGVWCRVNALESIVHLQRMSSTQNSTRKHRRTDIIDYGQSRILILPFWAYVRRC